MSEDLTPAAEAARELLRRRSSPVIIYDPEDDPPEAGPGPTWAPVRIYIPDNGRDPELLEARKGNRAAHQRHTSSSK